MTDLHERVTPNAM